MYIFHYISLGHVGQRFSTPTSCFEMIKKSTKDVSPYFPDFQVFLTFLLTIGDGLAGKEGRAWCLPLLHIWPRRTRSPFFSFDLFDLHLIPLLVLQLNLIYNQVLTRSLQWNYYACQEYSHFQVKNEQLLSYRNQKLQLAYLFIFKG